MELFQFYYLRFYTQCVQDISYLTFRMNLIVNPQSAVYLGFGLFSIRFVSILIYFISCALGFVLCFSLATVEY